MNAKSPWQWRSGEENRTVALLPAGERGVRGGARLASASGGEMPKASFPRLETPFQWQEPGRLGVVSVRGRWRNPACSPRSLDHRDDGVLDLDGRGQEFLLI